jgi:hypothetical protein
MKSGRALAVNCIAGDSIIALFPQLYVRTSILLTCGMHLHDRIISLTGEIWTHTTILTLPLFIEVPGPNTESERSCICVLEVSILPLSMIFLFVFGEFYRHSGI